MPTHWSPMNERQFKALCTRTGFSVERFAERKVADLGAQEGTSGDVELWFEAKRTEAKLP